MHQGFEFLVRMDPHGNILVVSDLHLGGDEGAAASASFCHFLEWIARSGEFLEVSSLTRTGWTLQRPSLIILLGDFVDLWIPRGVDRSGVLNDIIPVLERLHELGIEVVYVTGNHDHEMDEVKSVYSSGRVPLTIVPRHYPDAIPAGADRIHHGIAVGNNRYLFMHGHQFDMVFNGVGILREYPGWVANVEAIFVDHPAVPATAHIVLGLTILYLFISVPTGIAIPVLDPLIFFVAGIASVVALMSLPTDMFKQVWTNLQSRMRKSAEGKGVYSLIDEDHWKKDRGKLIHADTIIFGHTHVPEDTKDRFTKNIGKRFVNCGSWVPTPPPRYPAGLPYFFNTFVYIDDQGPVLLWWNDEKSRVFELVTPDSGPGTAPELDKAINRYFYSVR